MPKKIFDILPPVRGKARPKGRPTTFQKEKHQPLIKGAVSLLFSDKKKWWAKVVYGIFSILILVGIFSYFSFGEAQIEIWPQWEILNLKKRVVINVKLTEPNPVLWVKSGVLPGKFLEEEKEISQQFSSSGTKIIKEKAGGIIRVYNNYHEAVGLVVNTRFITSNGELFRLKNRIYIPAKSFIDTKVEAAEPGPDYNIKPSTFSIPGLVGYASYTAVYGKSFSPMSGGFLGEVPQVTEDDLEKAKNILVEKLKKEAKESLENKVGIDYILLEKAINHEVKEASSLVLVGAEVEEFNFYTKIKSKTIVFKKEDMENFTKEFILGQIRPSKKIHEESLQKKYFLQSVDLEIGKIVLSLEILAKIYSEIDISSIKKVLFGKSSKETQLILENQPQIAKVQVKFWPFWVKRVPKDEGKIEINLRVDPVRETTE